MRPLRTLIAAAALTLTGVGTLQAADAPNPETVMRLTSSWEVLWHQSGIPVRVARWEKPIEVSIQASPAQREQIVQMLNEVTREAGLSWQFSDEPNYEIQVVGNGKLEDNQPCVTYLQMGEGEEIDHATTQMRRSDVSRCTAHELMHAMGLRGHPSGMTVLSYFKDLRQLQPLDRMFLHAWYSPEMTTGMSPLQALPVLANQVVCEADDRDQAIALRDSFLTVVYTDMARFAAGQGDAPAVVKRSGKETAVGLKVGRLEMDQYLKASQPTTVFPQLQCKSAVTYQTVRTSNH